MSKTRITIRTATRAGPASCPGIAAAKITDLNSTAADATAATRQRASPRISANC